MIPFFFFGSFKEIIGMEKDFVRGLILHMKTRGIQGFRNVSLFSKSIDVLFILWILLTRNVL